VFSCDPTANLVHFDRLEPQGATFSARRAREGSDFLASRDGWFRPVFLAHGPDGALYLCDMYRKTIEHPDYLPVEIRKHTDFESGKTMGRIWRVVRDDAPADALRRLRQVDLARATTRQIIAHLSGDGWWTDTAHRLLLERRDPDAIEPLRTLATDPKTPPATVVHALYLLDALQGLTDDLLKTALDHPAAPVREHALILVEPRLSGEGKPRWLANVLPRADDENARVRFQAAITLGSSREEAVTAALARIAVRDGSDRWLRAAVFSSLSDREPGFLTALKAAPRGADPLPSALLNELGRLLAASQPRESWPAVIGSMVETRLGFSPEERAALLTGFAESARGRLASRDTTDVFSAALGTDPGRRGLTDSIGELIAAMKPLASDPAKPVDRRITAVGFLAFTSFDQAGETLLELVEPHQPTAVQSAAVHALGVQHDGRVASSLLAAPRFATYTPALRDEVLSAMIAQTYHLPGLLTAIEEGSVPSGAIAALSRRQLTQHRDAEIRRRAQALFGTVAGDRAKVYESYKDVVEMKSNAEHGRAVFRRECASCHRLDQDGFAVGPDLFGIRNQPKPAILLHILAPDHEITQGFAAYTVATRDGRVLTGLIGSETPTSITLKQPLGKEETILREQVDEISAGKQSLMPQGLEKSISRQEFADLLAYLKGEAP
jgi:putative heme-binding domain-containing protein